ncbi:hypothetical protein BD779DRAFT_1556458 [Infundibulicybe gibba]|nr:hypothetical protein BD779DRAFT_1556458 [Infundibulicybe gibba]
MHTQDCPSSTLIRHSRPWPMSDPALALSLRPPPRPTTRMQPKHKFYVHISHGTISRKPPDRYRPLGLRTLATPDAAYSSCREAHIPYPPARHSHSARCRSQCRGRRKPE